MRHVTVYTTNKEYNHFVQLTKNLHYVRKIETDEDSVQRKAAKTLKREKAIHPLEIAANELYNDYANDKELTAFTTIDFENFYEAK